MTTATRSQSTQSSAKRALLRQLADGTIEALSPTSAVLYTVSVTAGTCQCRGYVYYGRCYHLTDARARFPQFWPAPWATAAAREPDPEPPSPAASAVLPVPLFCRQCGASLLPGDPTQVGPGGYPICWHHALPSAELAAARAPKPRRCQAMLYDGCDCLKCAGKEAA